MAQVWLITGASRGIGKEIGLAALDAGHNLIVTARHTAQLRECFGTQGARVICSALDVTEAADVERVTAEAADRFGAIDVVVNNAGFNQLGWFEAVSDQQVRTQFDTNLFGAMNVLRAVLPRMRARRSGTIVAMSSASGMVSYPGNSIYSASKFAVEGWMEGLAQEVAPFGIRTIIVEPGAMRTEFLDGRSAQQGELEIGDYKEAADKFQSFIADLNGKQPGDPKSLARAIVRAVASDTPPLRLLFGADAHQAADAKLNALRQDFEHAADLASAPDEMAA